MARLLTYAHFTGECNISQLDTPAVQEAVQGFIDRYEPEALQKVFGKQFGALLQAAVDGGTLALRFEVLTAGGTYYLGGIAFPWPGISALTSLSFISAYVYYWWSRNEVTITTASGQAAPGKENGTRGSSVMKQVRAWNLFASLGKTAREFVLYATDASGVLLFPEAGREPLEPLSPINPFGI